MHGYRLKHWVQLELLHQRDVLARLYPPPTHLLLPSPCPWQGFALSCCSSVTCCCGCGFCTQVVYRALPAIQWRVGLRMCGAGAAARLSRLPGDRHNDPRRQRAKGKGPGPTTAGSPEEKSRTSREASGQLQEVSPPGRAPGRWGPRRTYSQAHPSSRAPASTGYPRSSCRAPQAAAGRDLQSYPAVKPRGAAPAAQPSPCPPRLAPPPRPGNGPGRLRSGSRPCGGGAGLSPCARRGGGTGGQRVPQGGPSQVGARGRGCHRARPGSPPSLPWGPVTRGPRRARRRRTRFAIASVVAGAAAVRMPQRKGTGRQTTRPCAGPPPRPSWPRSPSRERLLAARQCCLERRRSRRAAPAAPSLTDEPPAESERPGSSPVRPVCVRQPAGAAGEGWGQRAEVCGLRRLTRGGYRPLAARGWGGRRRDGGQGLRRGLRRRVRGRPRWQPVCRSLQESGRGPGSSRKRTCTVSSPRVRKAAPASRWRTNARERLRRICRGWLVPALVKLTWILRCPLKYLSATAVTTRSLNRAPLKCQHLC